MNEDIKEVKKIFGLEKNIFFVGLTSFLTDTTTKMIYSVMPMFLLSLGATKTELSLIEGIAESTASIIKALSGWWSDKIHKNKPFMIIGYGFTAILSPLFAFAVSPIQVLAIRFTERVGKGIRTAPRDSLVVASSLENEKGRSFGFHKAMDNCGAVLGPLLAAGMLLIFPEDYRKIFLVAAIPGLIGLANIIAFVDEIKQSNDKPLGKISFKDFSPKYYALLFIIFVFTLGNSTDALLLVKATDIGVASAFVPIIYLIFNSVSVIFAVPAGMLSDKIGREKVIIFGYILYAIIYWGFGRTSSIGVLICLFALYGLYSASTDGIQKALISDLIPKDKRGTGLGIYNCLVGMTLLPASLIAGALYDNVGNGAPFYYGGCMALMAAVLMILFVRANKE